MRGLNIFLLAAAGVFLMAGAAQAGLSCYQCHDKSDYQDKLVHKPVAEGKCGVCHNPHVARHEGLLRDRTDRLCLNCHDSFADQTDPAKIHKPVRQGECLACHDPHSSSSRGLLSEKHRGDSCFGCHEDLPRKFDYPHSPYSKGRCDVCHQPHQSENYQLLVAEPDKLCAKCHSSGLAAAHKGFPGKLRACLTCHSPHGSNRPDHLRDFQHPPFAESCDNCHEGAEPVTTGQCLECHEEVEQELHSSQGHLTSRAANVCINCHSPHASDDEKMFRNRQARVCRGCHADTFANYIDKKHSHPETESCGDCHAVHGSNQMAMLKGGASEVCSACHKSQGEFTHPIGAGVYDPRTGQELNCVTCHYPHGTDYKFNLKLNGEQDLCVQCHAGY